MSATVQMFDFDARPQLPSIKLVQDRSIPDSPTITKMAGTPYLPPHVDYPMYTHGPMSFMAQFNFAELPPLPGFPDHGILQIIGGTDMIFGYDDEDGSYVRYLEDTSAPSVGSVPEGGLPEEGAFRDPRMALPLRGEFEYALPTWFDAQISERSLTDIEGRQSHFDVLGRGQELLIVRESGVHEVYVRHRRADGMWHESVELVPRRSRERREQIKAEAFWAGFTPTEAPLQRLVQQPISTDAGHRLGGYPFFTQFDPRKPWENHILLAQLDTDEGVMWGDVGIVNWFIEPQDLANRDFSRVRFHWDCY